MQVLYHDDLDGAASAAMLVSHLRTRGVVTDHFTPIDYKDTLNWNSLVPAKTSGPFAIVDFQFHPAASIFFDHHPTSFLDNLQWYETHRARHALGYLSHWDPQGKSCCQVIFDTCLSLGRDFSDLVTAANIVDTAAYDSVQAYFDPNTVPSAMSQAYFLLSPGERSELIRRFMKGSLAAGYDFMQPRIEQAFVKQQPHLSRYGDYVILNGLTAITDLSVEDAPPFIRYAIFLFYPKARYSITLFRGSNVGDMRVSLSRNPWLDFEHQDLSEKVLPVGGGGHSYAAGVTFYKNNTKDPRVEAWRLIRKTIEELAA